MKDIDWGNVGAFGFSVFVAILLGLFLACCLVDHHVRRYYIGSQGSNELTQRVFADEPWEPDDIVFSTTDPQKAIDFMKQANAALAAAQR